MEIPPIPVTETKRLASLCELGILDTVPEDRFDRITQVASLMLEMPISAVTLVDTNRQWFKSIQGLEIDETPREVSFCGHTILSNRPFVVEDTHEDHRFSDNPLVTSEPFIRSYIGFPLNDGKGNNLGTLCVIDYQPRKFTQHEIRLMTKLAEMAQIELVNQSREEALAKLGASNRRFAAASQVAGHAVLVCAPNGIVSEANETAEAVFGRRLEQIVGQHISSIFGPPFGTEINNLSSVEIYNRYQTGAEMRYARPDGSMSTLAVSYALSDGANEAMVMAVRDVTARRKIEADLHHSEQLHRSVLAALSEAVFVLDQGGTILTANNSCPDLMAVVTSGDPPIINFFVEVMDTKGRPVGRNEWAHFRTLSTGEPVHEQILGFKDDKSGGAVRWIQFNTQPLIHPESEQPFAVVVSMTDVGERLELDRVKSEFVSMVSHELRTPLTAIRGAFGLLASGIGGEIPPKAASMLAIAETSTERLVRLVNDILDLHRMDSGVDQLKMVEFTDLDLIEEVVALMTPLAAETSILLSKQVAGVGLVADRDRLCQTLCNLIGNAIKFSGQDGSVNVSTKIVGDELLIRVNDNGRGIPANKIDDIFGRFNQVEMSDARDHGGTGLGLAISKQIVEQHGGRIWVESEFGVGSDFCFTIPLAATQQAATSMRSAGSSEPDFDTSSPGRSDKWK